MWSGKARLAKRTAGAPLTDAEIKQRKDAARARWGIAVGGAISGAAVKHALTRQRVADTATVRQAVLAIKATRKANTARLARLDLKVQTVKNNLKPRDGMIFVNQAIKTVRTRLNRNETAYRTLYDRGAKMMEVSDDGISFRQKMMNTDPSLVPLAIRVKANRALIEDLRTKGTGARRVKVAASKPHAVVEHTRPMKVKAEAVWESSAADKLQYLRHIAGLGPPPAIALEAYEMPAANAKGTRKKKGKAGSTYVPDPNFKPTPTPLSAKTIDELTSNPNSGQAKHTTAEMLAIAKVKIAYDSMPPERRATLETVMRQGQIEKIIAKELGVQLPVPPKKARKTAGPMTAFQFADWMEAANGAHPEEQDLHDLRRTLTYLKDLPSIEQAVKTAEPRDRSGYRDHLKAQLIPSFTTTRNTKRTGVKAVTDRVRSASVRRIKSYPNMATRKKLSDRLTAYVTERALSATDRLVQTNKLHLAQVRRTALHVTTAARQRLAFLTPQRRIGLSIAGAVGGGLAAAGLVHAAQRFFGQPATPALRKAADSPKTPRVSAVTSAIDKAEAEMAKRLAAMFGRWTDGIEAKLTAPSAIGIRADMTADLSRALAPLDAAVAAGTDTEVPIDGDRSMAFSLSGRAPEVTSYIDQYRQDRIVALADEQRGAIKEQLIDAARQGASPQVMARRIRDTIGLAPSQMAHVVAYRAELEALNPKALKRALRDKRFDGPIKKALEAGKPLDVKAVNRFVEAYHRRYLAYRAMTIARTEGVGGANNGQAVIAAAAEAEHPGMVLEKTWIAHIDTHTRDDHHELNHTSVLGLDTAFVCASGDEIRWPHDPQAAARQVINCRCAWSTRLVPRPDSTEPDTDNQDQVRNAS